MHQEVLTEKQIKLLPLLKKFNKDFGLVGGTAIAIYLGHRQSVDFDLFSNKELKTSQIRQKIKQIAKIDKVLIDEKDEYTIVVNSVKITFLYYPFKIRFTNNLNNIIKLPNLLTLAAMKAYALGRRAKWKDYVDLYFIIKNKHSLDKIVKKSKLIFKNEFNEKIFRAGLSYFKDIDYTEIINYLEEVKVSDKVIKEELKEISLS